MLKVFKFKEAALYLKISERTLFRYLKDGKIAGSKIGNWRFTEADLSDFLARFRPTKTRRS